MLEGLLAQTLRPREVHLHLSVEPYLQDEGFPNRSISNPALAAFLERHAWVRLHWVDNTGPYRKLLPLLADLARSGQLERDVVVVTLDDDMVYREDVLERLVSTDAPSACIRGFDMQIDSPRQLLDWTAGRRRRIESGTSVFAYATGIGGVLYRPSVFAEVLEPLLDFDLIREHCPTNEDIWLNFFRIVSGAPLTVVPGHWAEEDLSNPETALHVRYNRFRNHHQVRATGRLLDRLGLLA